MALFLGGIPTDMDIKKLQDTFPECTLSPGVVIPYSSIAPVIDCNPKTLRFKTVTTRWRNIVEKNTGIRIGTTGDGSFKVLSHSEKLSAIEGKRRSLDRQTRKNLIRTSYIDRQKLTDDERVRLDHLATTEKNILAVRQLRQSLQLPQL